MKNVLLWVCLLIFGFFYLSNLEADAQDKVVVVPLLGDDATGDATASDVLEGKIFSSDTGTELTGTLPYIGSQDIIPGTTAKGILEGYHDGTGEVEGDANLVSGNIRKEVTIFNVNGDPNVVDTSSGDAVGEDILNGKKAWVDGVEVNGALVCPDPSTGDAETTDVLSGKTFSNAAATGISGAMPNVGQQVITPTTSNQAINRGYHDETGYVEGAADLLQENIKTGANIFGVTGTFPSDGTATASHVKTGSTFYATNATLLTGDGTRTLSSDADAVTAGYYEETTLGAVDADLSGENIKKDVQIFGVTGTYPLAGVPKTGQTPEVPLDPAPPGSDGDLQEGLAWPNPRFTDNDDGTVTDNLTGLTWLKHAYCRTFYPDDTTVINNRSWNDALVAASSLSDGYCGLTDGSSPGDWRLPNLKELMSLIDWAYSDNAISNTAGTGKGTKGDPFTDVVSGAYWSSSTYAPNTDNAWYLNLKTGRTSHHPKTYWIYVWPVRGRR